MTPAPGEPNLLATRSLPSGTAIGDLLSIEGAGAYCASMSAKNYNSFPEAAELMLRTNGDIAVIRR
jgi:diaminopimelate decarboxylase